ncbi:MAG: TRAP transporter substrate-binding protein [Burkholderiales bacterium]
MRRVLLTIGMLAVHSMQPSSAAEFRWLSSWDRNYPAVPGLAEPYMKAVEAASKGSIKFIVAGPETVPPFEQLQPLAAGAFQFLFTHGAYHFGTLPLLNAVEALGGDLNSRRASGLFEYLDTQYNKLGVKLVTLPMGPNGGYQFVLRQPISATGDLAGRKIRGTPGYTGVIKLLGGSLVNLPPAEIYTSLDKGVVDGAAWPVIGVLNYRWYEVAKHLMRPAMGFGTQPIMMNLAAWNRLTVAERKILTDEGRKAEDMWLKEAGRLAAEEEQALVAKGMQITMMGEAQRAKLQQAFSDGILDLAAQKHPKEVEGLRAFAKSKGLLD